MPVTFTSRTLKPHELNYGMVEKEILALLRILDVCYSMLVTRPIKVLARHSTLAWLMRSTGLQGRLGNWAALLSPWTLEIVKCTRGEDEILGTIAASITPRENIDSILSPIAPRKQPRQLIPTVEQGEELVVIRGEIACKAPRLTPLPRRVLDRLKTWPAHEFLHVKRDWNQSTDRLANTALQQQEGTVVPQKQTATTRLSSTGSRSSYSRRMKGLSTDRVLRAQNEEKWFVKLKAYLSGNLESLDAGEARACSKIAGDYDVDDGGMLLYCPSAGRDDGDRDRLAKLVVPEDLQQDVLHHYHKSLQGGHQGVGRTYQRIRTHFHWRGLFKSVQRYVGQCTDCETGKGRPTLRGESPGNIQATYPFQYIAMDHIPSLPRSYKGNTELLIWVDLFTGYVIAKASASRTAQTIAENYEEGVFRRFGASEAIRHDREPGFILHESLKRCFYGRDSTEIN
ncbi:hypothetical protein F441_06957 [Phytophthora nicotianae CJ01A1]|uniref:Integrase catalytic domain-containing protein n=2 Tax=Phytophthora nicotianae TaxID=4792 RepID=W2X917_PHYNI|nr:hypothetical protein L915_06824 [Phytophthora nicotianae]ETP18863.1 hypothetical protein F441_06957 [Phytophthora nicotianae CJ01A1]